MLRVIYAECEMFYCIGECRYPECCGAILILPSCSSNYRFGMKFMFVIDVQNAEIQIYLKNICHKQLRGILGY
jgi:hypothetical protein